MRDILLEGALKSFIAFVRGIARHHFGDDMGVKLERGTGALATKKVHLGMFSPGHIKVELERLCGSGIRKRVE